MIAGQGHTSRSMAQLKVKVIVKCQGYVLMAKAKVIDEGQGRKIESQGHTSKSSHSSRSRL